MSEFVELVTGRGDPTAPHVGPEDDAALRRGIMGAGNYVFQQDDLDAVMKDANHITIPPMELLLHGRHARVKQAVDVPVDSGTQAQQRIDTACIQLTRDDEGIESADLIVVKGTLFTENPVAHEFDETADFDSASSVTVPLFDIPLDGITVGTPTQRFTQIGPLKAVWDSVSQTKRVDWKPPYTNSKITLIRRGNLVVITGNVKFAQSGQNNYTDATEKIPAGFRPTSSNSPIQCGNVNFVLLVNESGKVTMLGDPASGFAPMSGIWFTDDPV